MRPLQCTHTDRRMGNFVSGLGEALSARMQDVPKNEDDLAQIGTAGRSAEERKPNSTPETATEPAPLSKRAQKRLAKEEENRARKRARRQEEKSLRQQKKAERRAERIQELSAHPAEERERILEERLQAMRDMRAAERAKKAAVRSTIEKARGPGVCIDLGWNAEMTAKERKSLARQLAYSYSAMRKAVEGGQQPLSLSIVGMDALMGEALTKAASGWEGWPVLVAEQALEQVHSGRVVYLTHDAENVLDKLEEDCVYVVGGIVDRNRLKGATKEKAHRLGLETRRFDLDGIRVSCGTKVLTVNHCVEIMLHVSNGMSWTESFLKVLPERKGLAESEALDG